MELWILEPIVRRWRAIFGSDPPPTLGGFSRYLLEAFVLGFYAFAQVHTASLLLIISFWCGHQLSG